MNRENTTIETELLLSLVYELQGEKNEKMNRITPSQKKKKKKKKKKME